MITACRNETEKTNKIVLQTIDNKNTEKRNHAYSGPNISF